MATITIKFVGNQYDDNGAIKVSEKDIAFPENITLDIATMTDALQTVISSHRSYLYAQTSALESKKAEPNDTILFRLEDAESACSRNNPHWTGNDKEYECAAYPFRPFGSKQQRGYHGKEHCGYDDRRSIEPCEFGDEVLRYRLL